VGTLPTVHAASNGKLATCQFIFHFKYAQQHGNYMHSDTPLYNDAVFGGRRAK